MRNRTNLDLDTLRTLAVAHDLGGLAQAAERLGRTPSAVSLQMKRLQDDLGVTLFRKRGRGLALTEAGEVALTYARRILAVHDEFLDTMEASNLAGQIRIGCPQDFASVLPSVLSQFALRYPRMQVELFIEGNATLADAIDKARIDIAVVIGHEDRPGAETLGELEVVWIASSAFVPPPGQPLPLAVLGAQCTFRKRAIQHLEALGMPYRISANSPSLDGLWAALLAGLGVTARTAFNFPEGLVASKSPNNLPSLGVLPVTLHRSILSTSVAIDCMAALLSQFLQSLLLANRKGQQKGTSVANISAGRRKKA